MWAFIQYDHYPSKKGRRSDTETDLEERQCEVKQGEASHLYKPRNA